MAAGVRVERERGKREREREMEGERGGKREERERVNASKVGEKGKEGGSVSCLAILSASLVSLNMNVMLD